MTSAAPRGKGIAQHIALALLAGVLASTRGTSSSRRAKSFMTKAKRNGQTFVDDLRPFLHYVFVHPESGTPYLVTKPSKTKARFLKIVYDVEDFHDVEEFESQKHPRSMHDFFGTRNLKVATRKSPQVDQVFQFQGEACRLLLLLDGYSTGCTSYSIVQHLPQAGNPSDLHGLTAYQMQVNHSNDSDRHKHNGRSAVTTDAAPASVTTITSPLLPQLPPSEQLNLVIVGYGESGKSSLMRRPLPHVGVKSTTPGGGPIRWMRVDAPPCLPLAKHPMTALLNATPTLGAEQGHLSMLERISQGKRHASDF